MELKQIQPKEQTKASNEGESTTPINSHDYAWPRGKASKTFLIKLLAITYPLSIKERDD